MIFFGAFSCIVMGFYQQIMFIREWSEDHASDLDWPTRSLLSTQAIFYPSLSESVGVGGANCLLRSQVSFFSH
jgi:hypothetical protein